MSQWTEIRRVVHVSATLPENHSWNRPSSVRRTLGWRCRRFPGTRQITMRSISSTVTVTAQRCGPSTPVQEARTFWPCSRNWPCGPTYR